MILTPDQNAETLKIPKHIYLRILGKAVLQTQTDMKDMHAALPFSNYDIIQSISHRWKGDYDNMRITSLSVIAKELNQEVKAGRDKDKIVQLISQFGEVFLQLEAELASYTKI